MSLTPTTQIPLGFTAPDFTLPDTVDGEVKTLQGLKGEKGTLVMFISNHCPFVKHVNEELAALGEDYIAKGISVIAIGSNDIVNYPEDSPELMGLLAAEEGFTFPYLYDETQEIAKAYSAACTPDFSIFDANLKCVYRGQLDDSRPGNGKPVTGKDIRDALDALLTNKEISTNQKPSIGCNIKWKVI